MPTMTNISQGSDFDAFLFAAVGEDQKGMVVSVLSAFARLNLDPWEEAEMLAKLPGVTARSRLTSLVSSMSSSLSANIDPGNIANRLAKLLPKPANPPSSRTLEKIIKAGAAAEQKNGTVIIAVNVLLFLFMLGLQMLLVSHPPAAQGNGSSTPITEQSIPVHPNPSVGR